MVAERAEVTQQNKFGQWILVLKVSMSELQLWSKLVAKCQNTDLTIMGLPTSPRNRDTANEERSTVTEYLTKLNDMCAVETELDDTRHPEHCAHPWTGESWMECRLSWVESSNSRET